MYTKEELEKIYDTDPNKLAEILKGFDWTEENIIHFLNCTTKDRIISMIRYNQLYDKIDDQKIEEYYEIPEEYKKAEFDFFQDGVNVIQEDRNQMYDEMNNSIDKMTGKKLQALYDYENEEYAIGIHRTSADFDEILEKGIKFRCDIEIDSHVQMFENFPFMLHQIKHCEGYKFSRGCIIVKVPKKSIKGNIKEAEPIYYKGEDGEFYLRPEYIAAFVPVKNKKIGDVLMNEYSHDNLYNEETEFFFDAKLEQAKSYGLQNYGFINIFLISITVIFIVLMIILKIRM